MSIRIVDVRRFRSPEQRATVCYCGRAFAGWQNTIWANPFRVGNGVTIQDALAAFRTYLARRVGEGLEEFLALLWEACDQGKKPLGCWCIDAVHGDGQPIVCHAQILAAELAKRFLQEQHHG